jgi:hypothetical protein
LAPDASAGAQGPQLVEMRGYRYRRRRPERTVVYRVVHDNLETLYAAVEEGFVSASLPDFVRGEFERFLDCGLLCKGAALLTCEKEGCSGTQVVALSCLAGAGVQAALGDEWCKPQPTWSSEFYRQMFPCGSSS